MLTKILSILLKWNGEDAKKRKKAISEAKEKRKVAVEKIDGIIAQINGCGDRWFLQPMETIDECSDDKVNGDMV